MAIANTLPTNSLTLVGAPRVQEDGNLRKRIREDHLHG